MNSCILLIILDSRYYNSRACVCDGFVNGHICVNVNKWFFFIPGRVVVRNDFQISSQKIKNPM